MAFAPPALCAGLLGLLGLLVGSFLNVVVYRLPKMLEREWAAECAELHPEIALPEAAPFNLMVPRSRCPHCAHPIAWYQNIPVASYLALGGRCAACRAPISVRYPLVELANALLFALCGWRFGLGPPALLACIFSATVLALALIDWDTTLLPDSLTQPLLWLGLIASAAGWSGVDLYAALWGAVGAYLSLWSVFWLFKLVTGKDGMGYGDFKLFAALGAWFGAGALIPIILLASVIGAIVGIALKFRGGLRDGAYVPFGPFLAGAGLAVLLVGANRLLQAVGL